MNKYFTYVIKCDEKRSYIGVTSDYQRRINEHNDKLSHLSGWTKRFNNWRLVYLKEFNNYTEARKWEIFLKKQKGGNGLRRILENYKKGGNNKYYSGVEQSGSSRGS